VSLARAEPLAVTSITMADLMADEPVFVTLVVIIDNSVDGLVEAVAPEGSTWDRRDSFLRTS
jgi:hypothetical protein